MSCSKFLVTYIERLGPYLKIYGQLNPDALRTVQAKIQLVLPTSYLITVPNLQIGTICLCKRYTEICRARITETMQTGNLLQVEFIDYGYEAVVNRNEVFIPQFGNVLEQIPSLCSSYIVLGVLADWSAENLQEISRLLVNQVVEISIEMELDVYKFVHIKWREFNFAEFLILQKKIGAPVQKEIQRQNFQKIISKTHSARQITPRERNAMYNNINPQMNMYQQFPNNSVVARTRPVPPEPISPVMNNPRYLQASGNLLVMPMGYQQFTPGIPPTYTSPQAKPISRYVRPVPPAPLQQQRLSMKRAPPTLKTNILTVGSSHEVRCTFVENGPCLFFVQLVSDEKKLSELMNEIETLQLKPFEAEPTFGAACIARYTTDNQLYRAVITAVQSNSCRVSYIDYGTAEFVQLKDIYEITEELTTARAFAARFTLSGCKALEPMDENLKKRFREMVLYKKCTLTVVPTEGPPMAQYCELRVGDNNVLDMLKQIKCSRQVFPKAEGLANDDIVQIRFIASPKNFYVQKESNMEEFDHLMDEMFVYYNKKQIIPNDFSTGTPCMVKCDNAWYRAEVMHTFNGTIYVRHVDFGYEQKVTKDQLSAVFEKHFKLPRQAVQCCLKGFENNEMIRDLATTQFEMLAAESNRTRRSFSVKVFRVQPNGAHLVNLCTKDLNVMKKLYKLSMPFDQYLALEKNEFNTLSNGQESKGNSEPNNQTPIMPLQQNNQHRILETKKTDKHNNLYLAESSEDKVLRNSENNNPSNDSNTNVSSSLENSRDSSSSSSEHKSRRRPPKQQRILQRSGNRVQGTDQHKADTSSSEKSSFSDVNKKNLGGSYKRNKDIPPRFLNARLQQQQQNLEKRQQKMVLPNINDVQQSPTEIQPVSKKTDISNTINGGPSIQTVLIEDYSPLEKEFPKDVIQTPAVEAVAICWWMSPFKFYTHLKNRTKDFEKLMDAIQMFYRNKPFKSVPLKVGSHVIARYREDNILYRARIIACNQMLRKYRVIFVDFGNQSTVSDQDIWQVEKRFTDFPIMAYTCSFENILPNHDNTYMVESMVNFLPMGAKLVCEYLECDDDLYYVKLNVNESCLKTNLIKHGLLSKISPDICIELLVEQQIRAKFISITDMLNFKIQIEGCDVTLLCSYDDAKYAKSNPDKTNKFQAYYQGKSCVLNITQVTEDKMLLVHPMLPLFKEDVSNVYICPYPLIRDEFDIKIMNVVSANRLHGHCISTEKQIGQLLKNLFSYYESKGTVVTKYEVDGIYAVKSADGNWYRGKILSKKSAIDNLKVFYVDYGSTELIDNSTKTKIKRLEPQFYANGPSAFAIEVNLPMKSTIDNQQTVIEELSSTIGTICTLKVIEIRLNRLIADLFLNDCSLVNELKSKGMTRGRDISYIRGAIDKEPVKEFKYIEIVDLTIENDDEMNHVAIPKPTKVVQKEIVKEKPILVKKETKSHKKATSSTTGDGVRKEKKQDKIREETTNIKSKQEAVSEELVNDLYKNMESGMLSHCDNPGRFFIHHTSKLSELSKLQENLQIVASSLPPLMRIVKGAHCITLYSVDHQWYRAKIMDSELMVIQFIDYGNTDAFTDITDVKEMSVFPDIEPLCIPCALPIRPNRTADWVDAANAFFNASYNKTIHFEYITKSSTKNFINLYIDGVNVADKLVKDGYAKSLEMVRSGESCFVSHINNLSDFYIQMEQDSKALELIESHLTANASLPKIDAFKYGLICAALFPDDSNWYRAKLLSKKDNGFEVLFIDYGNTAVTPQIKEVSEIIAKLPPLSKKCALQLPENVSSWSEMAEEKFLDISALGETVFVVELKEPSDRAIVHLSIDGKNIIEDLEPLCEQILPSESELNTSFYSGFHSSISESVRQSIQDAVVTHVNSPCDFYIHFKSDIHKFEDLSTTLNEITMNKVEKPEPGMVCAAILPRDGTIYRVKLIDKSEKDGWDAFLIDRGIDAVCDDLRVLPSDLRLLKPFAKKCTLENSAKYSTIFAATEVFNMLLYSCRNIVKVDVIDEDSMPILVKLYQNDENFCEKINRLLGIQMVPESHLKDALVSHVVSPSEFYVQMKDEASFLDKITKTLSVASDRDQYLKPSPGDMCAAFSEDDGAYHRGVILNKTASKSYEVFLIDYGNTIIASDLRMLNKELKSLPGISKKCCLHGIPPGDEKTLKDAFDSLMESYFGEVFQLEVVNTQKEDNDILSVNLVIRDNNICDELKLKIQKDASESKNDSTTEDNSCIVVYINSPNDFYVQVAKDRPQLEKISERLLAGANFDVLTAPKVGSLCVAQYSEDNVYYRAEILAVNEQGYEVMFIDFGNTSVTDQVRKIPEDLRDIMPMGKRCSLEKTLCSDELNFSFRELINSRFSETFQLEILRRSNDRWLVRLFYQATNILTELENKLMNSTFSDESDEEDKESS